MSRKSKLFKIAAIPVVLIAVGASMHARMMAATRKPPASEFGYGPRASANGTFEAIIEDSAAFAKGKMLKPVVVRRYCGCGGAACLYGVLKVLPKPEV